ncbi:MAG: ABC transporter permease [Candidatus Altiarchaeales archaeon A3]|nr:MAG: ABC transporter permease [Candidatus Altiarchaeales archaeon A3]
MSDKKTEQENFEIIIKPNKSWFYIDWQGLLHYNDLLFLLVKRDFVAKYKQTILGPLWFIIQPLMMTLVFTIIFGNIAKLPTDGVPPMIFYLCGLLAWTYFANCLIATSTLFVDNAALFGKVYFPRLVVPLSIVISNLFAFAIQLATFLAFFVYFKYFTEAGAVIQPNLFILVLPLLLIQTALFALGFGLWLSALTAKYRDLTFVMGFLIQIWMYATPIIYPISMIPEKWQYVAFLNPMVSVVESYKYAFFGTGVVELNYLLLSAAVTVIVLLTGILVFNRTERTFIDTV